jgi:dihydroorotase-like cyclic amidohydrolase
MTAQTRQGRTGMTTTLFTDARLIDPEAGTDGPGWLLIEGGVIAARGTGEDRPQAETVIDCAGQCLAPGIVDIGVKVCEPGERHKESYRSAGLAAAAGGVTTMATRPDTLPAIDTPEVLEFVERRANEAAPVNVLPMAALTKDGLHFQNRAFIPAAALTRVGGFWGFVVLHFKENGTDACLWLNGVGKPRRLRAALCEMIRERKDVPV